MIAAVYNLKFLPLIVSGFLCVVDEKTSVFYTLAYKLETTKMNTHVATKLLIMNEQLPCLNSM
jgi:hypothetical protein